MTLPRSAVSLLLLGLAGGVGCGPEAGGSPERVTFETAADADVAALDDDAKSDTPSPNALRVFEIVPGTVVAHEVTPAQPRIGFVFRAESAAAINANAALRTIPPVVAPPVAPSPPPVGPTANMVVYRRMSCLGRWDRVPNASATAVLATRLRDAGEYLLVTGATNPNTTATLSASFAADSSGKIVTDANPRPGKIAQSWLPVDALDKLRNLGLKSFGEIAKRGTAAVVRATGLSQPAVEEMRTLSRWLDTESVDYQMACALKRAGVDSPEAYYRLPIGKQRALEPTVKLGTIPVPPWRDPSGGSRCVDLETPGIDPRLATPTSYVLQS